MSAYAGTPQLGVVCGLGGQQPSPMKQGYQCLKCFLFSFVSSVSPPAFIWAPSFSFLYCIIFKTLISFIHSLTVPGLSCAAWDLWSSCGTWGLVPWPRVEPRRSALGAQSLSLWTTREVPVLFSVASNLVCVSSRVHSEWFPGFGVELRYNPRWGTSSWWGTQALKLFSASWPLSFCLQLSCDVLFYSLSFLYIYNLYFLFYMFYIYIYLMSFMTSFRHMNKKRD